MKKIIWTLIIVLLWAGFRYLLINTQIFDNFLGQNIAEETTETTVQTTWFVFINDAWFEKTMIGWLESIKDEPGGLTDIAKCKTDPSGFSIICNEMQKTLDTFVLWDYTFVYSWFTVTVVDMSTVSGHQEVLASWLAEFTDLWKYPEILANKILTNTIWLNRNRTPVVVDLTWTTFPNADVVRTYISFEWQDGVDPIFNIIFRKWTSLVKISYRNMLSLGVPTTPTLTKLLTDFRNNWSASWIGTTGSFDTIKFLNFYTTNMQTNTEYQALIQTTLANTLNRFAIK